MISSLPRYIGLIFITSALGACATPPKPTVVTEVKSVVVQTPAPLLRDCPVSAPPDQKSYMTLDMSGRENALTDYILELLKDLKNCNSQIGQIRTFQNEQTQLYDSKPKP